MKAFVTGHRGYVGSHLVALLRQEGHAVVGCDLGLFDGCEWGYVVPPDRELRQDVRSLTARDLDGCDCVMHLAALSNDAMGAVDDALTLAVNREASGRLARIAKEAGVPRFLFAGSCSVYGQAQKPWLEEPDPLNPLTAYARSKIDAEAAILAMAGEGFCPTSLRNATAYGDSPMLRIDLVANNLLGSALAYGEVRIQSDGSPWRPLIHCRDIARAFVAFSRASPATVSGLAVNVGANAENFQVRDVATVVQQLVPAATITYTGEVGADPRNYRVRFDRLATVLPGFSLEYDLARGLAELHRAMKDRRFSRDDFEGDRWVRLRTLRRRIALLR